jgi:hypothetical protein
MTLSLSFILSALVGGGATVCYFGCVDHSIPALALGFVALLGGLTLGITARGVRGRG